MTNRNRLPLSHGLRLGIVLATILSLVAVSVGRRIRAYAERERAFVDAIVHTGGEVRVFEREHEGLRGMVRSLWDLIGRGAPRSRYAYVSFREGTITRERVKSLSHLETSFGLLLSGVAATDLSALAELPNDVPLIVLAVDLYDVPTNSVGRIPLLSNLENVTIRGASVDFSVLSSLAALPSLSILNLYDCDIGDNRPIIPSDVPQTLREMRIGRCTGRVMDVIARVARLQMLEHIELTNLLLPVSIAEELANNDSLRVLSLFRTTIEGGDLSVFCGMKLRELYILESDFPEEEIEKLQRSMPTTTINRLQAGEERQRYQKE